MTEPRGAGRSFPVGAEEEGGPAGEQAQAAEGRDGPEPTAVGHRQEIERTGKDHDAGQEEKAGPFRRGWFLGEQKQHDSVDEMVKDGRFPDGGGVVLRQQGFEGVGAKGPQRHGEKPERGGDAEGGRLGHGCFAASAVRKRNWRSK